MKQDFIDFMNDWDLTFNARKKFNKFIDSSDTQEDLIIY